MKILQVNCTDLIGHIFDGYDLMNSINLHSKHSVKQIVEHKHSDNDNVIRVSDYSGVYYDMYKEIETRSNLSHMLKPMGQMIMELPEFREADIVHYHILHNRFISLFDYPELFNAKKSVWTIHDPWITTGDCIYPLECQKWQSTCEKCDGKGFFHPGYYQEASAFTWKVKREVISKINPHIIVSCDFMRDYLKKSPITSHFNKIHEICFGVDTDKYSTDKYKNRRKFGLREDSIVIGLRTGGAIKGADYVFRALKKIRSKRNIELIIVGNKENLHGLDNRFNVIQLGWVKEESEMISVLECCDIFTMTSLAESFGLMAIEAMAAGCVIVGFKNTVVERNIKAPEVGVAADYCSVESLQCELEKLINNPSEIIYRGRKSRELVKEKFSYDRYVREHEDLYETIYGGL
ncbi:MAG: glycosyltransferase [Acetatifactor sp.]|nr:glycosyltransferase [Acetatifactor sp.]